MSHSLIEQFEVDQDEQMAYYLISEKGQDTEEQKPFRVTQASGVQMTVLGHFKTLAYLQAWISDLKSVPNRFQVYLTYGKEFADLRAQMNYLNELDNKPFLHLENRASQQLPLNKIESVLNEWDVKVRVCKVPALVEKLEQLYSDPSLRMQIAEKHSNSIKEKCSPQVIAQQFYEFLEKVR